MDRPFKNAAPVALVLCVLVVVVWEILSHFSARPFEAFDLTAADFRGFQPRIAGWVLRSVPVATNDPAEPNILAFEAQRGAARVLVRLVHGYNMPMCMKIKEYRVEEIGGRPPGVRSQQSEDRSQILTSPSASATSQGSRTRNEEPGTRNQSLPPQQVWRLTSSTGTRSVWVTTMLRAGDFGPTDEDIRAMAFPRVDSSDDPRWLPQGVDASALRHPVVAGRSWFRARWNSSRTDLLTFLRLRQPRWASEERLSFVSCSLHSDIAPGDEQRVVGEVSDVHHAVLVELRRWRLLTPAK